MVSIYGKDNYIDIYMDNISISFDKDILNVTETNNNGHIRLVITAKKTEESSIVIEGDDKLDDKIERRQITRKVFVHNNGVITLGSYFGHCNGDISFIISFYIILVCMLIYLIYKYIKETKKNLYSYENARRLGLICFILITTIIDIFFFVYDLLNGYNNSIDFLITSQKDDIYLFIILVFPIAVILTIFMTISNIKLLKEEGKKWTNMLGILLGGFICLSTLASSLMGVFLSYNKYLNVISYIFMMFVAYLECVFIGTCVLGIKSAKHIPRFDKDAILILGCKVKKDGTLTNILKARVDKAIEFGKMQKENTGKDIIYIPSGGKGKDETISEAQAMKNYLLSQGIKEKNILIEDKSKNTFENIKFSNEIIKEKMGNAKLAFSTTNYHVFRAGTIATNQNIDIEGIGAKTKTYYWINAFIREFVATLVSEKKNNVRTLIVLMIIVVILTLMTSI